MEWPRIDHDGSEGFQSICKGFDDAQPAKTNWRGSENPCSKEDLSCVMAWILEVAFG